MSPHVSVDARSGLAPWRQIHDQLTALVDAGDLAAGARLPAIRRLARDLGVAPGTVARAYRELEAGGRVRTARGGGTVAAARVPEGTVPVPAPAPGPDPTAGTGAGTGTGTGTGTAPVTATPACALPGSDRLLEAALAYLDAAQALGADPDAAVAAVRAAAVQLNRPPAG